MIPMILWGRCVPIFIKKTSSKSEVDALLNDVRIAVENGKINFDTRKQKNMDTLAGLGYTIDQAYDEICSLSYDHYISGPEPHDKYPHLEEIWVFKKEIFTRLVYIKLWVMYSKDGRVATLSFHFDNM